ncbi:hypothetical protein FRX31_021335, partial [Thalictrum thalictroides]
MAGGSNTIQERVARIEQTISELVGVNGDVQSDVQSPGSSLMGRLEAIEKKQTELSELLDNLSRDMEQLAQNSSAELGVLKRAMNGGNSMDVLKKVPEPKAFSGARDAKELENFLWDME